MWIGSPQTTDHSGCSLRQISGIKLDTKLITGCLTLAWFCFSVFLTFPGTVSAEEGSSQAALDAEEKLLEGSWVRSDGGYVLELRNIENEGTLTAAYFNPRQIRVWQAFWTIDEGSVALFVELRDINYPGSKYSLRYDPITDQLKGVYFQAVGQQIYEIEFVRNR